MMKIKSHSLLAFASALGWPAWLLLIMLLVAGCGQPRPPTVRVTGTVTYRGSPVSAADINFIPRDGRPASGRTDNQGQFTLTTFVPGDGVLLGEHIVTIGKQEPKNVNDEGPYVDYVDVLPAKYADIKASPLRATVDVTGPRDFIFELD